MKKIAVILWSGVFITSAIFFFINNSRAKQRTVNVYNWGEFISDGKDGSIDVNREFTKRTGIKVNYNTYQNNESLLAKLRSGGINYDVIIPSDYMIAKLIEYNMLEKLDFDKLPNFNYIDPEFRNLIYDPQNAYSVPYVWGTVGIIYNKRVVDIPADEITWDIFWDKKYKGKILMFDNPRDALAIAQLALGISVNDLSQSNFEKAARKLREQKPLVQAYVMDQIFDKMSNEEAALAPYYTGDAIILIKKNPKLNVVIPKNGTTKFIDSMCIPKGAEHYNEALQYINFMCDPRISKANSKKIGYSSPEKIVREDVALASEHYVLNEINKQIDGKTQFFNGLPDDLNRKIEEMWVLVKVGQESKSLELICTIFILLLILVTSFFRKKMKNKKNKSTTAK